MNAVAVPTMSGWSVDVVYRPLAGKNHDSWVTSSHAAAVVDGATPLSPRLAAGPEGLRARCRNRAGLR